MHFNEHEFAICLKTEKIETTDHMIYIYISILYIIYIIYNYLRIYYVYDIVTYGLSDEVARTGIGIDGCKGFSALML